MASLYKTSTGRMFHAGAICLVPVGLPARGKTFMSRKLSRYLRWLGVKTQVFNVGAYRRTLYGTGVDQSFFDLKDAESFSKREHVADKALEDMMQFFQSGGQVGIYDTTMTIMQSRRQKLVERCAKENVQVVFIETICDRQEVIEANIREVKLTAPEYVGWELEEAVKDFLMRIDHHVPFYDALNDPSLSYIKVINLGIDSNVGEHIVVNNVKGYLQTRLVYYLMNLHIARRTIYFLQV
ncbi:6-phosphofructo-2-kinase [Paraphysoderma sedebokerense]|nr:6-phosphofructo-2-kinase [Paraphysoderma sedebokerense]